LLFYLQRLRPDVLITLANVWWLSWIAHPLIATAGVPWWLYYPLDGDCGDSRLPESWIQILRRVDLPIAMSRYGLDVTARNGVAAAYIPHGVDTGLFRPPTDKIEAKAALGYRGRFVIVSDARNQERKQLPRTLEIFRRFAAGKPDVLLHLHCDPDDSLARSPKYWYDLRADIDFLAADGPVRITPGMSLESGVFRSRIWPGFIRLRTSICLPPGERASGCRPCRPPPRAWSPWRSITRRTESWFWTTARPSRPATFWQASSASARP
jgi:glycosyltransferase involved in cell wall biosynthesis